MSKKGKSLLLTAFVNTFMHLTKIVQGKIDNAKTQLPVMQNV